MKTLLLLLLLATSLPGCCNTQIPGTNAPVSLTISQLPDTFVTEAIKKMEKEESLDIKRESDKIIATTYFHLLECGNYSASAKVKNDSIIITVNNSKICDGNTKYYKLEAVIDNPKNIAYDVWADPAFTFLSEGERIGTFRDHHLLGDINGDRIKDSVIVEYERVIEANDSISTECGRGTCYMTAKFGKGIPDVIESSCYGMSLEPLPDINGDGRDEIIMGTYYSHGCCHMMYILSFDGKKWNQLAEARTFNDDEPDASRVIKKSGRYYLHYKDWDDENADIVEKKVKVKVR